MQKKKQQEVDSKQKVVKLMVFVLRYTVVLTVRRRCG